MSRPVRMLERVEDYLNFRRQLGFTLRSASEELILFARYADRTGHRGPLTIELALRWAKMPAQATPMYWAWRLAVVRKFAQHLALDDPSTEVPAPGLLGRTFRQRPPHIYSTDELAQLIRAANALEGRMPSRTYGTLFGLLASTGLRVGEALRLTRATVDLEGGVLFIEKSKAAKSRMVPLHASTTEALRRYASERDRIWPCPKSDAFFISFRGTGLTYQRVTVTFRRLRRRLKWPTLTHESAPRVHDLRHTFAVRVLLRWYENGENIDEKIVSLASYLGHVNPTSTYWYLTATPELMAVTARRFEAYAGLGGNQ